MSTDYGLYANRLEHYQIKFKRATLTLKAKKCVHIGVHRSQKNDKIGSLTNKLNLIKISINIV